MSLLMRFQLWKSRRSYHKRQREAEEIRRNLLGNPPEPEPERHWPPDSAPEQFGYRNMRAPYPGRPDFKLARDVARILFGKTDPTKRIKHLELVAIYEDDTETLLYSRKGHCRVTIQNLAIYIDPPIELLENKEPPDVLPPPAA